MRTVFGLLLFVILTPQSYAIPFSSGTEGVGGGGGMVCQTTSGKSVELLEFWESEYLKGMRILRRDDISEIDQARNAIKKLVESNPSFSKETTEELYATLSQIWYQVSKTRLVFLPPNVTISPPNDTIANFVQRDCHIEGIALYFDQNHTIQIDKENYELLSKTAKAGLLVHETIYKFLRKSYRVENSISARGITACLFTKRPCAELNIFDELPHSGPFFECRSAKNHFIVYPTSGPLSDLAERLSEVSGTLKDEMVLSSWRFQFLSNGAKPLFTKTYFDLARVGESLKLSADGVLHKEYAMPEVRVMSSPLFYLNFPSFENFKSIKLEFSMDSTLTKFQGLRGSLDEQEFTCLRQRY